MELAPGGVPPEPTMAAVTPAVVDNLSAMGWPLPASAKGASSGAGTAPGSKKLIPDLCVTTNSGAMGCPGVRLVRVTSYWFMSPAQLAALIKLVASRPPQTVIRMFRIVLSPCCYS